MFLANDLPKPRTNHSPIHFHRHTPPQLLKSSPFPSDICLILGHRGVFSGCFSVRERMNRKDGSSNQSRRAQTAAAVISIALTFIFVAYLFRHLATIENFDLSVPILFGGVALSLSLFFLTRDQIKARARSDTALAAALTEKSQLNSTIEKLQSAAKASDTDIMISRAVELQ